MTDPIERIEAALAKLGSEHEPPPGWEARVLAATGARDRRRWSWLWLVGPTAVVATAVVLFVIWPHGGPDSVALAVTVEHRVVARGTDAQIGDVLHVALTSSALHHALRIYREENLVAECPGSGAPVCTSDGGASVPLDLPGTYRIIALGSSSELAKSTRDFDDDQAAVIKGDVRTDEKTVTVR